MQRLDDLEVGELAVQFDDQEPAEVLKWAFEQFHPRIALMTSFQADGMVLLDMAWRINPDVRVITLDTGRLPEETHELMDEIRGQYGIHIEVLYPDTQEVEKLVKKHGVNLFYRDVKLRLMCCQVRKVRPLVKALR
ncbi:MAG: phosphoadenosine phosphosulfate reductase family protein, partial [Nitrospira sp.]|nr:phosphoadenosine phosphosulfate reductase family protein [Nitrospira sp.]